MDYEQFYLYLNTRPVGEIIECMKNLDQLVEKHKTPSDVSSEAQSAVQKLSFAQQTWTHQAIWNKFGTDDQSGSTSLEEVAHEASILATSKEVAQYIVSVTEQIDAEAEQRGKAPPMRTPATVCSTPSTTAPTDMDAFAAAASPRSRHSQMCGSSTIGHKPSRPQATNKNAGNNRSIWSEEDVSSVI